MTAVIAAGQGARRYPVIALGVLAAVDGLHGYALLALGPDIARSLGVGAATIAAMGVFSMLMVSVGSLMLVRAATDGGRRAFVSVATGAVWSAASALTAFVTGPWGLAATVAADGASTGSVRAVHPPLITDLYPGEVRVRAFSAHRALDSSALVLGPALVAGLSAAGLTWRGVFLVLAGVSAVGVLIACCLRDPATGREAVSGRAGAQLSIGEQSRQLLSVATVRRLLAAHAVAGVFLAPLLAYLFFFLEDRWGLGSAGRAAFLGAAGAIAILFLALFAAEGERLLREAPSALITAVWPLLLVTALGLAVAVVAPSLALVVAAFSAAFACLSLVATAMVALLMTLVPPEARTCAAALAGIALAGIGGAGGLLLLGGLEESVGTSGAVASLALPAIIAALVVRAAASTADQDHARLRDRLRERERIAGLRTAGGHVPLLACRGVTYAYDHRRAVDAVDFSVDAGEAVALLGTNGAGKTTLLRVIAGHAVPLAGAVRLDGAEISYLDPERRAALGLAFTGGGEHTFGALSVRDSLRVVARAAGMGHKADDAVDEQLERFPRLGQRSAVRAAALSGGERHLLALAQALVLRPRLLLVDEPTRSLATESVAAVVATLRELTAEGTAVVAVEQSIEVAQKLAPRALFLDGGRLRFDGPTAQLPDRTDLLRPLFLRAAAGSEAR